MNTEHVQRVHDELREVGVTKYGMKKLEVKELPSIIQPDEHIGGAVYGQVGGGSSAMLVATNKRVLFVDHRPLFSTSDELTYDVVAGVQKVTTGLFTAVTLHTRVTDYTLRYVNPKCANIFVSYIDKMRITIGSLGSPMQSATALKPTPEITYDTADKKAMDFLRQNEVAVLSSVDRTGNVRGSVVYYHVEQSGLIYIVTKDKTNKVRNIVGHGQVALTVYEPDTLKVLQISGVADIEGRPAERESAFKALVHTRKVGGKTVFPPVTKLKSGGFIVLRITPQSFNFTDYAAVE